MSYGREPKTEEGVRLLKASISKKIANGTIIDGPYGIKFEVLRDTSAHGCPDVKVIEITDEYIKEVGPSGWKVGDITCKTLYEHYKDPDYVKSQQEGM